MIQANELRIGNWVMVNGRPETINYLSTIPEVSINGMDAHLSFQLSPIPLTDKILMAFGLTPIEVSDNFKKYFFDSIIEVEKIKYHFHFHKRAKRLSVGIRMETSVGHETTFFIWGIKHLHDLQNIYHALTFKELELIEENVLSLQ